MRHIWQLRRSLMRLPPPAKISAAVCATLLAAALGYGAVASHRLPTLIAWAKRARDSAANSLGFRIDKVSLSGNRGVSREEILATAGVTDRTSLLFFDAAAARARLLANPWIADAAVLKLYPDRLQFTLKERRAYALWQKNGHISVIAADGTVLERSVEARFLKLPLVVGRGAERQAKDFLAILDRYRRIRSQMRAAVLVARRRWDLHLDNGIDIELPETGVARALHRLVALNRSKKLLSRNITIVDLRLPDRVTVRLSAAAAEARRQALDRKKKAKGGEV
jgi:cell division protein FtsQ